MAPGSCCFRPFRARRWKIKSLVPNPHSETEEEKRLDSLESWEDAFLESDGVEETGEGLKEEWTADLSQLFIGNRFASGARSRIYRGVYKQRAVAVKMVRVPSHHHGSGKETTRARLEQQFISEVSLLSSLYHPNIVQFIAACKKPPVYCIITEYMPQGTLRMYLNKKEPFSLPIGTVLRLALDVSHGMAYLHSKGVIHRDLKSSNLLLDDKMRVKIADFGTSCLETQCRGAKGSMGTFRWMAPEMIKGKSCTRKVDVYSFGIVLWEITTSLLPFQGMTPVQAAFAVSHKNERPPLPASFQPAALAHLIKRCWAASPSKRPDFVDIVSALEIYDEHVREGLPLAFNSGLVSRNAIVDCFKSSKPTSSSSPLHV
ncbi:unnamed protein product [Cuscuta campestris]|uniref:non-specific serine/threonine protein kinase n=1 Tax=Cuscuta campestris TaxID=132261 RepID=A0A484N6L6_9ASTE|nr:unnamed protein product [Cuscuta campestris]